MTFTAQAVSAQANLFMRDVLQDLPTFQRPLAIIKNIVHVPLIISSGTRENTRLVSFTSSADLKSDILLSIENKTFLFQDLKAALPNGSPNGESFKAFLKEMITDAFVESIMTAAVPASAVEVGAGLYADATRKTLAAAERERVVNGKTLFETNEAILHTIYFNSGRTVDLAAIFQVSYKF